MSGPALPAVGLESLTLAEFTTRPDLRQICTFFLGWLFLLSLQYTIHSPILTKWLSNLAHSQPQLAVDADKLSVETAQSRADSTFGHPGMVLTITICFFLASITQFASLLAFDEHSGASPCTFLVAWGGLNADTARILCLILISFDLRQLGIKRWETLTMWGMLVVATGLMFLSNAVSVGTLKSLDITDGALKFHVSLCYRQYSVLTGATSSSINLSLELYTFIRSVTLIPSLSPFRLTFDSLNNIRLGRILSLITLEAVIFYPSMFAVNLAAAFIPFSLISMLVLAAFNHMPPHLDGHGSATTIPTSVAPVRVSKPPPSLSRWSKRTKEESGPPVLPAPSINRHPYNAESLQDLALTRHSWLPNRSSHVDPALATPILEELAVQGAGDTARGKSEQTSDSDTRQSFLALEDSPSRVETVLRPVRAILPSQASYAGTFSRQLPNVQLPAAPPRARQVIPPPIAISNWSDDTHAATTPVSTPNNSIIFGSDILQREGGDEDHMQRSESPRTAASQFSFRDLSPVSGKPAEDHLSVVYERSTDETQNADRELVMLKRPTFGEVSFEEFKASGPPVGLPQPLPDTVTQKGPSFTTAARHFLLQPPKGEGQKRGSQGTQRRVMRKLVT